jgi:hypothetical protein
MMDGPLENSRFILTAHPAEMVRVAWFEPLAHWRKVADSSDR